MKKRNVEDKRREEQWVKEDKEEEEEVEVWLLGGKRRSGKGS